jgi:hypothetical protein
MVHRRDLNARRAQVVMASAQVRASGTSEAM